MIVRESARIGSLKRIDFFAFPHDDLGPLPYPYDQPDVEGLEDFGSLRKTLKKITTKVKKVVKKIVPKPIAKAVTKVAKKVRKTVRRVGAPAMKAFKKAFPKIAPILAIAAQVLNFIPGLGVVAGIAIAAGGAALAIGAKAMAARQQKKELTKIEEAEVKALEEEAAAQEKVAHEKANEAFAQGEEYFTSTYEITAEQFNALSLEDKMSFLQQAIEDKKAEDEASQELTTYVLIGAGVIAVGTLALLLLRKK